MIELPYSLVIEATDDPEFFGFFSPDLEGFTGIGHSIEDCLYRARWGMRDHLKTMEECHLPLPARSPNPTILIQNEQSRGELSSANRLG
jgi:predicted RNase H-like HicB family nuclease